jgi:hypothetical protein
VAVHVGRSIQPASHPLRYDGRITARCPLPRSRSGSALASSRVSAEVHRVPTARRSDRDGQANPLGIAFN